MFLNHCNSLSEFADVVNAPTARQYFVRASMEALVPVLSFARFVAADDLEVARINGMPCCCYNA